MRYRFSLPIQKKVVMMMQYSSTCVPLSPSLRYVRSARERELIPSTPGAPAVDDIAEPVVRRWTRGRLCRRLLEAFPRDPRLLLLRSGPRQGFGPPPVAPFLAPKVVGLPHAHAVPLVHRDVRLRFLRLRLLLLGHGLLPRLGPADAPPAQGRARLVLGPVRRDVHYFGHPASHPLVPIEADHDGLLAPNH